MMSQVEQCVNHIITWLHVNGVFIMGLFLSSELDIIFFDFNSLGAFARQLYLFEVITTRKFLR